MISRRSLMSSAVNSVVARVVIRSTAALSISSVTPSYAATNLLNLIRTSGHAPQFVDAVEKAGLVDLFSGQENITAFVPIRSNVQFENIPSRSHKAFIEAHVVRGRLTDKDLLNKRTMLRTLSGANHVLDGRLSPPKIDGTHEIQMVDPLVYALDRSALHWLLVPLSW